MPLTALATLSVSPTNAPATASTMPAIAAVPMPVYVLFDSTMPGTAVSWGTKPPDWALRDRDMTVFGFQRL